MTKTIPNPLAHLASPGSALPAGIHERIFVHIHPNGVRVGYSSSGLWCPIGGTLDQLFAKRRAQLNPQSVAASGITVDAPVVIYGSLRAVPGDGYCLCGKDLWRYPTTRVNTDVGMKDLVVCPECPRQYR